MGGVLNSPPASKPQLCHCGLCRSHPGISELHGYAAGWREYTLDHSPITAGLEGVRPCHVYLSVRLAV